MLVAAPTVAIANEASSAIPAATSFAVLVPTKSALTGYFLYTAPQGWVTAEPQDIRETVSMSNLQPLPLCRVFGQPLCLSSRKLITVNVWRL